MNTESDFYVMVRLEYPQWHGGEGTHETYFITAMDEGERPDQGGWNGWREEIAYGPTSREDALHLLAELQDRNQKPTGGAMNMESKIKKISRVELKELFSKMTSVEQDLYRRSCQEGRFTSDHVRADAPRGECLLGFRIALGSEPSQKGSQSHWVVVVDGAPGYGYAKYSTNPEAADAPPLVSVQELDDLDD